MVKHQPYKSHPGMKCRYKSAMYGRRKCQVCGKMANKRLGLVKRMALQDHELMRQTGDRPGANKNYRGRGY